MKPIILDFDQSVKPLPEEKRISLGHFQEAVRLGCTLKTFSKLNTFLDDQQLPSGTQKEGVCPVFIGSGDYHHISHLLISRFQSLQQPLKVIVFDNHPDNMLYPFGIHCGSWIWHLSQLPFVKEIHVLGINSSDVEIKHALENHLRALIKDKVHYWCVQKNLAWMKWLGIHRSYSFDSIKTMIRAFFNEFSNNTNPVYLSIDKDVLSEKDVHTNWDQGVMKLSELKEAIIRLKPYIVGCDITGEVSNYHYKKFSKKFLSFLDQQPKVSDYNLQEWQAEHHIVNQEILRSLST